MRKAYNNVQYVYNGDQIIGVSLGYDFAAEHEWGIKGIKNRFGIDSKKIGVDGRSVTKSEPLLYVEKDGVGLLRTNDFWNKVPTSFDDLLPYGLHPDKSKEIQTAWDEGSFGILGKPEFLKGLNKAFTDLNIVFATINDLPAFGGTSLCILIKDRLPKEVIDQLNYVDNKAVDLDNYEKEIGITRLKEKKYESVYSGNFDAKKHKYWMALSPRWINYKNENPSAKRKNKTDYDIMYWVNYGDNDVYGWYTVEQIKEWLTNQERKLKDFKNKQ